ncbi:hypothetical protein [Streptomyces sp. I6]|uniref:hypothetical protein n=1 Tax=Streptomyces sp. I6 TaxID=2483113 RepID=UPI0028806C7F|nr:hypothetical protein [Streptomyces sp. I6]
MISRVSAGILLICAVLLHVVTPLCATPGTPRAEAAVASTENRNPHTAVIVASADGAGLHHDEYDRRNHPSRLAPLSTHAPPATAAAAPARAAPRTRRRARRPPLRPAPRDTAGTRAAHRRRP